MDSICFFPKSARVWSNSCPRFHRDVERLRETSEDRDDEKGEVPAPVARDAGEPVMWPHGLRFQVSFTISQGGAGVGTAWRGDAGLFRRLSSGQAFTVLMSHDSFPGFGSHPTCTPPFPLMLCRHPTRPPTWNPHFLTRVSPPEKPLPGHSWTELPTTGHSAARMSQPPPAE